MITTTQLKLGVNEKLLSKLLLQVTSLWFLVAVWTHPTEPETRNQKLETRN